MRLASHNIKVDLPDHSAAAAVRLVLQRNPDVIGLQEWGRSRRSVLAKFGTVVIFPRLRRLWSRYPDAGYVFCYPLGGQPIGVDASRWEVLTVRRILLSAKRPGVRAAYGTELTARPRDGGKTIPVLNLHLLAHLDREQNHDAWLDGIAAVRQWVDSWTGFDRYVMGDFNHAAVPLDGLRSCCSDKPVPTFKGRPIDHIYGPRGLTAETVHTSSDHNALVVDEQEKP